MTQPCHHIGHTVSFGTIWNRRAINHYDRKAQFARCFNLGVSPCATSIFRHHQIDLMIPHQCQIILHCERPARHQNMVLGKRRQTAGRVDQTQQIEMLRIGRKVIQMHAPHSQHHARSRAIQRPDSPCDVTHMGPVVARLRRPRRTGQSDQRHILGGASDHRIATHLRRKRMRCIDHMGHAMLCQISAQALNATKATDTLGQWLAFGSLNPTCKTDRTINACRGHCRAQSGRLGGAPKDQEVHLHV